MPGERRDDDNDVEGYSPSPGMVGERGHTGNAARRGFERKHFGYGRLPPMGTGRDHLPDMAISWNKVTLRLTTQRTGHTITELDRRLAARVDTLAAQ